jgi:hypothetical protein
MGLTDRQNSHFISELFLDKLYHYWARFRNVSLQLIPNLGSGNGPWHFGT